MKEAIEPYEDKFEKMIVSKALLTDFSDYDRVVEAIVKELPQTDSKTAVVLMGHGTSHFANSAYPALDYVFKHDGYQDIFVGTVEGAPTFDQLCEDLKSNHYEKILMMPLMMVAGDHAHNDMAGDTGDSWKLMLKAQGYEVDYILKGMGELPAIRELFIEHAKEAIAEEDV
jgi:sirohydrochlorin cobaltochelatase